MIVKIIPSIKYTSLYSVHPAYEGMKLVYFNFYVIPLTREDEEVNQRTSRPLKSGVPPVSPHACIRDAVTDELFDDVWKEVVGLLDELLHKYCEKPLPGVSALLFELNTAATLEMLKIVLQYRI